jgi:hypothetical protein
MSGEAQVKKADFQQEIVKMAAEDKGFREQLLADPMQALKSAIGFEPPPGLKIRVVEEDPTSMYIVLPVDPASAEGRELGDEEMDAVAGGASRGGMQMQSFARGSFANRFQTEGLSRAGTGGVKTPGGETGVTVTWG